MAEDVSPDEYNGPGHYKLTYGHASAPAGPFATIPGMAQALGLTDYPADGYVVWWDDEGMSSVPSLNPDDLVSSPHQRGPA